MFMATGALVKNIILGEQLIAETLKKKKKAIFKLNYS